MPISANVQLTEEQREQGRGRREREESAMEGAAKGSGEGRMAREGEEMEQRRRKQREGSDGRELLNKKYNLCIFLVQELQS